jgi:alkanesulfonate monooxygenase SsuD/methylene tetrahydromethanopterin reductase-like flavin-dependent oxidoreductase (luciferase family)
MELFRERCAHHGSTPVRFPVRQDVFVADDDAAAAAAVGPAIAAGYRGMDPATLIYGSVGTVAERLRAFAELGFTDAIVRQITVEQSAALRSYELLADVQAALADA